jgi:preprotein translocase subunit SecA
MLETLRERTSLTLAHLEFEFENEDALDFGQPQQKMIETRYDPAMQFLDDDDDDGELPGFEGTEGENVTPVRSRQAATELDPNNPDTWGRVSRNEQCPCGSGKKYKQCHGKLG